MAFKKIVLLFFFCQSVFGQQLQFDNIGQRLQLPSQECYNIMQDSKGYIWFSTEQGFCRYDGNKLTVFDRTNGLPEGGVYSVVEDKKGRLWLSTAKNRILVYENGRLKEASFSKSYVSQLNNFDITYSLILTESGSLYINADTATFIADIEKGTLQKLKGKKLMDFPVMLKDRRIIPLNSYRSFLKASEIIKQKKFDLNIQDEKGNHKRLTVEQNTPIIPDAKIKTSNAGKNNCFFSTTNKLIKTDANLNTTIYDMPQRVLSQHIDKDGGLWIGMLKKGLYYYPTGDPAQKPIVSLSDYSVSGVFEDAEKNIWCTTLEKGIFICPNKNIINYFNIPVLRKPVDLMKNIEGTNYFSAATKEIVTIKDNSITTYPIVYFSSEPIREVIKHKGKWYISGLQIFAETNPDFTHLNSLLEKNNFYHGAIELKECNGKLFGLGIPNLFEIDGGRIHIITELPSRARCFECLSDELFLCATNQGVYYCERATKKCIPVSGIHDAVTKILKTPDGEVWITTKGGGLYRYIDGKAVLMNDAFKLPTKILYDIVAVNGNLWIASNKGLIKITQPLKNAETKVYGTLNGLPSNDIYKLSFDGKKLFLSTLEGVCYFLPNSQFTNNMPPRIYLSSVKINGIPQPINTQWKLRHDQNNITLIFDALTFKNSHTQLLYQLKGKDNRLLINSGNEITLANLPPEIYKLTIYALNADGVKSKNPVIVTFQIDAPFWLTWWFITVCIIAIGLVIYFFIRRNIRKIEARETEKTRINKLIADSQLSALQAQMNPHFIFNAINSIQNYILKKQEKEAYSYLAKFSKLIRLVLHNSQQSLLLLHEELETVNLYVELEQLRFGDSFDFVLQMDTDVDAFEIAIPTMIIQPYIENAIWHGLMNLDNQRRGKILLAIEKENELLKISIEDNGIGRALSAQYKKQEQHRPVAMKLTEQRLSIVNEQYDNKKINVEICDLYNDDGTAKGTKVIIILPFDNFE